MIPLPSSLATPSGVDAYAWPDTLAVFDNDGTLCDTQDVEGRCYAEAILRVTGKSLRTLDWENYEEPTSSCMVRDLLAGEPQSAALALELAVEEEFTRLLSVEHPQFPGDFTALPGAVEFLHRLESAGHCRTAIATGCFAKSARFKLQCCGIDLDRLPHASSSDTPRRRDILSLAAKRAGFETHQVIYFGDAPWDVKVCQHLGIPMIGIGRRTEHLQSLGVKHVFRDYSQSDAILDAISQIIEERG